MNRFIKLASVKSMTGLSKSSIYTMMVKGSFPKKVQIGERSVAWVEAEIQQWIDETVNRSRVV